MKITGVIYILWLIIAVISNCNAQNEGYDLYKIDGNDTIHEKHSITDYKYDLDFYK